MKQKLISILESFGFPVYLQGTLSDEAYPDTFITFFCTSTEDDAHFDDEVISVTWSFSIILYSNNPTIVNTKPSEILARLKSEGFVPQGKGNDILSDEKTHTGWAMDAIAKEIL